MKSKKNNALKLQESFLHPYKLLLRATFIDIYAIVMSGHLSALSFLYFFYPYYLAYRSFKSSVCVHNSSPP
jgi:hypothetical protein